MVSVSVLRELPLLAGIPDDHLEALAQCLMLRTYPKDTLIFHQGVAGDALFFIKAGRVRIFLASEDGEEITLNTFGPGEVFGEMSLLDGRPRSASAQALGPTTVLRLDRADFALQLAASPPLIRALVGVMLERFRYTTAYAGSLAFLDVNARVASRLLEFAGRTGQAGTGKD